MADVSMSREPTPSDVVSVVLAVRNRPDTIEAAVASVLSQTYRDLVLFVVDDASTDDTPSVVGAIADDRLNLIRLPVNVGVSAARNAGIHHVRTPLLAFQDSDDVWHPRKLELQVRALRAAQLTGAAVTAMGCRHELYDGGRRPFADAFGHDETKSPPVTLYARREVLAGCTGGDGTPKLLMDLDAGSAEVLFDTELPAIEDRDFLFRSLTDSSLFGVVDRPLISVRRGRTDHAATSLNADVAYRRYLLKYRRELESDPLIKDWYTYLAARQALLVGKRWDSAGLRRQIASRQRWLRTEWWLGAVFGHFGLKVAAKTGLRPSWEDRCCSTPPV